MSKIRDRLPTAVPAHPETEGVRPLAGNRFAPTWTLGKKAEADEFSPHVHHLRADWRALLVCLLLAEGDSQSRSIILNSRCDFGSLDVFKEINER